MKQIINLSGSGWVGNTFSVLTFSFVTGSLLTLPGVFFFFLVNSSVDFSFIQHLFNNTLFWVFQPSRYSTILESYKIYNNIIPPALPASVGKGHNWWHWRVFTWLAKDRPLQHNSFSTRLTGSRILGWDLPVLGVCLAATVWLFAIL